MKIMLKEICPITNKKCAKCKIEDMFDNIKQETLEKYVNLIIISDIF